MALKNASGFQHEHIPPNASTKVVSFNGQRLLPESTCRRYSSPSQMTKLHAQMAKAAPDQKSAGTFPLESYVWPWHELYCHIPGVQCPKAARRNWMRRNVLQENTSLLVTSIELWQELPRHSQSVSQPIRTVSSLHLHFISTSGKI